MNKNSVYLIILLTLVWVVLCEELSPVTVATGIVISAGCAYFCRKYLPLSVVTGVNFLKLSMYPFYLIGQIYLSGFDAIKMILTGASVSVVKIETSLTNNLLRVILANSITLTPGTVSLELKNEKITVLRLTKRRKTPESARDVGEDIKGRLEKMLLKAQK